MITNDRHSTRKNWASKETHRNGSDWYRKRPAPRNPAVASIKKTTNKAWTKQGKLTRCFLIQPYYTPFFTKIQAFCKIADNFVDSDKIYVNFVMSTHEKSKHLFLSFSLILTTSCAFLQLVSLNIVFELSPSFSHFEVSISYSRLIFVHIHNHLFLLRLAPPFFSAQWTSAAVAVPPAVKSAVIQIESSCPPNSSTVINVNEKRNITPERMHTSSFRCMIILQDTVAPA